MIFQAIREEGVLATSVTQRKSLTKPGQFIMDSAAGVSVANESSWMEAGAPIMDLPPGASNLSGVGGDKTAVTAVSALFKPLSFMQVNHAIGSVANIISIPDLQEKLYVHYRDQRKPADRIEISIDPDGAEVVAIAPRDPSSRYYMLQAPEPEKSILNIYSDAYSRGHTKNSIARAIKVRSLHRAFSYVGLERLKSLVRSNRFGDIGPKEISLYEELHAAGDCPACRFGKTTVSAQVTPEHTRATEIGELIIADIVEIKSTKLKMNKYVLIAVDDKSAYTHVRPLEKKDIANVVEAFTSICRDYSSFGWHAKAIKLDGDGAFREIAPHIAGPLGVMVIPTSPYKHAVVAERMIRTLSSLFRSTIAGLPYVLAPHMFVSLLEYCASSNNLIPNDANPILSPTELFTRRPPEYQKLLNIEYGKLVTFHKPSTQNDEMRANVGVIVGRDVRRPGHALLWDLMGGGVVARNDFKPLAWNQALMKAYVDTAMGAHEATDEDVDRSVYYEASDIEMSAGDIDELCENESAEPGTLRAYEGVKRATELTEEAGTIDISRPRNDHRRALLRLIDIANASGDLLEDENENETEEATTADAHGTRSRGRNRTRTRRSLNQTTPTSKAIRLKTWSETNQTPKARQWKKKRERTRRKI
jgi:hypothetical protein